MSENYDIGDIIRFIGVIPHYAVYIGSGEIVHYNKADGYRKAHVIKEKLTDYYRRSLFKISIKRVEYSYLGERLSKEEIKQRALERVGEGEYNVVLRNCENFVTWCVYGVAVSECSNTTVGAGTGIVSTAVVAGTVGTFIGGGLGSVVPVVGTAIGGCIGGAIGTGIGSVVGSVGGGAVGNVIGRLRARNRIRN